MWRCAHWRSRWPLASERYDDQVATAFTQTRIRPLRTRLAALRSRVLLAAISLLMLLPADALARAGGGSRGFRSPSGGGGARGSGRGFGGPFFFFGGGGGLLLLIVVVLVVLFLISRARRQRRF